jgi:hypothetical protein
MNYYDRLHPWVIYRRLPNFRRAIVARFRRLGHAEEHLKAMQRMAPDAEFVIAFESDD